MTQRRMTPEERRGVIVQAALKTSEKNGLSAWTRQDVAEVCAVATSAETVKHYFPIQDDLRKAVLADPGCSDKLTIQGQALGLIPQ